MCSSETGGELPAVESVLRGGGGASEMVGGGGMARILGSNRGSEEVV